MPESSPNSACQWLPCPRPGKARFAFASLGGLYAALERVYALGERG